MHVICPYGINLKRATQVPSRACTILVSEAMNKSNQPVGNHSRRRLALGSTVPPEMGNLSTDIRPIKAIFLFSVWRLRPAKK